MKKFFLILMAAAVLVAPMALIAADFRSPSEFTLGLDAVITQIAYDGDGNIEYLGIADPKTGTGDAEWLIRKFTYSSGNLVSIKFANGRAAFDAEWDERASYVYK